MKFNPEITEILTNFSFINPSMVFQEGKTLMTVSPTKTIVASAAIEDEIKEEFAIYDLSRLLRTISMFDAPAVVTSKNHLDISDASGSTTKYYCTPSDSIYTIRKPLPNFDVAISFDLKQTDFDKLTKAMGIMKLTEARVVGDGKKMHLEALNIKNTTSDLFSIPLGETDKTFSFVFKAENLRLIPGDYKVDIAKEAISKFTGEKVTYVVAMETSSTYDG